jgi:ribosomal protein L7Ae-like RNA K-turn-binding protein
MDSNGILSLLGLALRGNNLAVGEEPVEAVARARDARVLLVASDAADNTYRRVKHFADAGQCIWLRIPFTKAELGQAVGRSAAAVVAVTDIGLANAVVRKLAQLDPVKYDEAAARLELKAKRAAERKAEMAAHEKNVRTGKVKAKKQEEPAKKASKKDAPSEEAPKAKRVSSYGKSRPSKDNRPKARANSNPYAHSRPVKKGKGSFRKKEN